MAVKGLKKGFSCDSVKKGDAQSKIVIRLRLDGNTFSKFLASSHKSMQ